MDRTFTEYYDQERMFHGALPSVMGTRFDMLLVDMPRENALKVWEQSVNEIIQTERIASRFDPESEVSLINSSEPLSCIYVSDELRDMLTTAAGYHSRTDLLFDITLGQSPFPQFDSNGALNISNRGCHIDFGGFAKGYALKRVAAILAGHDVKSAFVDFGNSSILAIGSHPNGDSWWVSVPDPFTGREIYQFRLRDTSLSISGNTPMYNTHIIDPRTGQWECGKKISAVMTDDPLDAEVLSTTWMLAGTDQRNVIATHFDIKDEFVYID